MEGVERTIPTDYDSTTTPFEWYIKNLSRIKPTPNYYWTHRLITPRFSQSWQKTTNFADQLATTPFYHLPRMYTNILL